MKHQLSFANVNILSESIAEVIVHPDIEISIEMVEEYHDFLTKHFPQSFAVLVNKINAYDYSFEAKLSLASHENLKAIAVVNYTEQCEKTTQQISAMRQIDGWNLKTFSGLELGWQQGLEWLEGELNLSGINDSVV